MRGKRFLTVAFRGRAATAIAPPAQATEYAYRDPMAPALTALTGSAGEALGRGGKAREPSLDQTHSDLPSSAKGKAGQRLHRQRAGVVPHRHRRLPAR